MKVIYKCTCMPAEVTITVVDRDPARDVVEWMETIVLVSIGYDHKSRSPNCTAKAMEYAKLEVRDGQPLGQLRDN